MSYSHADILDNRRKWIDFLKEPTTQKATDYLVDSENPEARCCLGHACHVLEIAFDPKTGRYDGELYHASRDVQDRLGLWGREGGGKRYEDDTMKPSLSNGQTCLAWWNDGSEATPQDIGAYLETVIMGGDDTPFKPIGVAA